MNKEIYQKTNLVDDTEEQVNKDDKFCRDWSKTIEAGRAIQIEENETTNYAIHNIAEDGAEQREEGPNERHEECTKCKYNTTDTANCRQHFKSAHRATETKHYTKYEYISRQALNPEQRVRAVQDRFKSNVCPKCDYKARQTASIKRHIHSVHDKLKGNACPKCDYKASQAGSLKLHKS